MEVWETDMVAALKRERDTLQRNLAGAFDEIYVLRAKLDDWAAQRDYVERAEQAEGQCEAVSKECIRLQEKLAEAEAARKEMFEAAEQYRIDWKRAEAEVERLREVVAGELAYRHTVEAQVVELSAQANQLEREAGAAQDEVQRLKEENEQKRVALLLDAAAFARLRARWPHIEFPVRRPGKVADPGPPACLRCMIEREMEGPKP